MLGLLLAALFALMGLSVGDCIETLTKEANVREEAAWVDGVAFGSKRWGQEREKGADDAQDTGA